MLLPKLYLPNVKNWRNSIIFLNEKKTARIQIYGYYKMYMIITIKELT